MGTGDLVDVTLVGGLTVRGGSSAAQSLGERFVINGGTRSATRSVAQPVVVISTTPCRQPECGAPVLEWHERSHTLSGAELLTLTRKCSRSRCRTNQAPK